MAQVQGLVTALAQDLIGSQAILFRPRRGIGDIRMAQVTIEETHTDDLEITDQPVEMGAPLTDHAFMRAREVVVKCGWSDSPSVSGILGSLTGAVTSTISGISSLLSGSNTSQSRAVYQDLLALQQSRIPFTVYTGKRRYPNMLIKSLRVEATKETENALIATITLREVIMVATQIVSVSAPAENQSLAPVTAAPVNQGAKQLTPATNYSPAAGQSSLMPGQ